MANYHIFRIHRQQIARIDDQETFQRPTSMLAKDCANLKENSNCKSNENDKRNAVS